MSTAERGGRTRWLWMLATVVAAALSAGCASPAMKGTPFYTGMDSTRAGPAKGRLNLWPVLYYREPAFSLAWPLIEKSDELMAVRPIFSAYGLNRPERVYSVLWPISEFDQEHRKYRVFPFFWGDRYVVGFPFYWHSSDPENGWDALFPLWINRWDASGTSHDVLWPLVNVERRRDCRGWRAGPLAGSYTRGGGSRYRFLLWPLGHDWSDAASAKRTSVLFPLFASSRDGDRSLFLSLPYSSGRQGSRSWHAVPPLLWHSADSRVSTLVTPLYSCGTDRATSRSWSLLLPVAYRSRSPQSRLLVTPLGGYSRGERRQGWMIGPGLAMGTSDPQHTSWWVGGILAHGQRSPTAAEQYVLPAFYHRTDPLGSTFLSLPYSRRRRPDGGGWDLAPPFLFRQRQADSSSFVSPLYCAGRSTAANSQWQAVFPLYYRSESPDGYRLATLLGGVEEDRSRRRWIIYPLLSGGTRSARGGDLWIAAPLVHVRHRDGVYSHHVLPVYLWDGAGSSLYSLLAAHWRDGPDRSTTVIPPLLSWARNTPGRRDLWLAGGLARWSRGADRGMSYVIPIGFRGRDWWGTPLVMHGPGTTVVPPLLSWSRETATRHDVWMAGGLARWSGGAEAGASYVAPVFFKGRDWWASPLIGHITRAGQDTWFCPPALGGYNVSGDRNTVLALAGLLKQEWGGGRHASGRLLPLYWFDGPDRFLSLPFGWSRDREASMAYVAAGLAGVRGGRRAGGWLWPLFGREHDRLAGTAEGFMLWGRFRSDRESAQRDLFPLFHYARRGERPSASASASAARASYSREFWCLPGWWYENAARDPGTAHVSTWETRRRHGAFPLWSYSEESDAQTGRHSAFRVLGILYDDIRRSPPGGATAAAPEYLRKRILWRFWHYQRSGQDVTVDMFPAITYDRVASGQHGFSFLWRFIRYDTGPEGTKCDLLFLPVKR